MLTTRRVAANRPGRLSNEASQNSRRRPAADNSRPWNVSRGGRISAYRQYAHLARLDALVKNEPTLRVELGLDYMISPDVTVSFEHGEGDLPPVLHAAVSCKSLLFARTECRIFVMRASV